MYSLLSLDRTYNFLNYAGRQDAESAYAISLINFGVSDIEEYDKNAQRMRKFCRF